MYDVQYIAYFLTEVYYRVCLYRRLYTGWSFRNAPASPLISPLAGSITSLARKENAEKRFKALHNYVSGEWVEVRSLIAFRLLWSTSRAVDKWSRLTQTSFLELTSSIKLKWDKMRERFPSIINLFMFSFCAERDEIIILLKTTLSSESKHFTKLLNFCNFSVITFL